MSPLAFIIVHGGAGVHSYKNEEKVKQALKTACTEALKPLTLAADTTTTNQKADQQGEFNGTTLDLVETAIRFLEDDPYLNAGYGSNLTIDGTVECDASIMYAHGLHAPGSSTSLGTRSVRFGSVGALSGIKNPISAARVILEHSARKDSIGRVPPLTLVANGAYSFASFRGVPTVPPEALITAAAQESWQKWRKKIETFNSEEEADLSELRSLQDTVGAVAFYELDGAAAGVSSGGLLLKYPGRVGEAATHGAGCWVTSTYPDQFVACSVSGTGEFIIKFALARRLGEALVNESSGGDKDPHQLLESLLRDFWELGKGEGDLIPSAGVILLIAERCEESAELKVRLWCAFTTESMAIAYASTKRMRPKAAIVRRPYPTSGDKPQIYITSWSL